MFPTADALAMDLAAACTYALAGRVHSSVLVLLAVKVAILKLAAHQHPATVSEQTYPAPELKTEFRLWLLLGEGLSASWNPKLLQSPAVEKCDSNHPSPAEKPWKNPKLLGSKL